MDEERTIAFDSISLNKAHSSYCNLKFSSQTLKSKILDEMLWLDLSMYTPKKLNTVWYSQSTLKIIFRIQQNMPSCVFIWNVGAEVSDPHSSSVTF